MRVLWSGVSSGRNERPSSGSGAGAGAGGGGVACTAAGAERVGTALTSVARHVWPGVV